MTAWLAQRACWFRGSNDPNQPDPNLDEHQLRAFIWYQISRARESVGQALTLATEEKLRKAVANYRERFGNASNDLIAAHVKRIAENWETIQRRSWTSEKNDPIPLDEHTVAHGAIGPLRLDSLLAHGATGNQPTGDTPSLSPEDRDLILSSSTKMGCYIQYGVAGLHVGNTEGLTPTPMNWQAVPGWSAGTPHPELWSTQHLMGYYWYLICWRREQAGIALTMPNWGRIGAAFKSLNLPSERIYSDIRGIIGWWHLIDGMYRPRQILLPLDETTIQHRLVRQAMDALRSMDEAEFEELRQRILDCGADRAAA